MARARRDCYRRTGTDTAKEQGAGLGRCARGRERSARGTTRCAHAVRREAATADWLLFIDEDDIPDDALLDSLVAAQVATGADVVTAGVRPSDDDDAVQLFLGDPGSLGLIENQYGVLGLVSRPLAALALAAGPTDSDWVLMARLAAAGAHFVSIPETLSEQAGRPETPMAAARGRSPSRRMG